MQSFINYAILIFLQIFEFHKNVKLHTQKKTIIFLKKLNVQSFFFFFKNTMNFFVRLAVREIKNVCWRIHLAQAPAITSYIKHL